MCDSIQGTNDILPVFRGSVDNRPDNCKVFGTGEGFKLTGHLLFDFDIPDGLF